ncbi:MAG: hypothetical protein GY750_10570 [Lentisphaerae bacterium]|nr:hypothetical protein [Lentisphaerota bacterium]MCP4101854.1 hypothetical protein [Lentisphaerota bacterium]
MTWFLQTGCTEHEIQNTIGYDVPVMIMIGCSGDINHLDVEFERDYCCYEEACRIGTGYAKIITANLEKLIPIDISALKVKTVDFNIPFRKISEEVTAAKKFFPIMLILLKPMRI